MSCSNLLLQNSIFVQSHPNETCSNNSNVLDPASMETISKMKKCPKCKVPTERSSGCNHMTCQTPGCNMEWCYICEIEWDFECMRNHWVSFIYFEVTKKYVHNLGWYSNRRSTRICANWSLKEKVFIYSESSQIQSSKKHSCEVYFSNIMISLVFIQMSIVFSTSQLC